MKKIVLFDMDGTLTPPRKRMENNVLNSLGRLQKSGFEIGIVTGSDMNYLLQQILLLKFHPPTPMLLSTSTIFNNLHQANRKDFYAQSPKL